MAAALRLALLCAAFSVAAAQVHVDGSGTTNPSKFFWKIMEAIQARSRSDLRMTYRAVGSGTGQREFSQQTSGDYSASLTNFGAGDIPMSQTHYSAMTTASQTMVHVPFCMGAIAVFHSVPADEVGTAGLKLSACVLADIYSGKVTTWDHASIVAENPGLQVPAGTPIKVGRRSSGSSSTGGITGYLQAKCSASWTRSDGTAMGSGSSLSTWPTITTFTAVEGSPGMTNHIASQPYAIGYLDAGHGHQRNFQEVKLKNEADRWLTSSEAIASIDSNNNNGIAAAGKSAVDAGSIPADVTADWSSVNLYRKAGDMTWPIVLVSYIYLKRDLTGMSQNQAGLLRAFVDIVTGTEGQGMLSDFSFNRVPAAMNVWASNTRDTVMQWPTGITDYTILTSTSAWTGQGANVISSKRNSYSMWKLDELDLAVTALQSRVVELESSLNDYGIVPLHGSGTTNPKNWFAKAMKLMESRSRVPLLLTYRAVGSSTGQKEFVGNAASNNRSYNHFGAGDIPMSADRHASLMSQTPPQQMVHLPFALGAIGIFHSVPAGEIGASSLQLSACVLAKIFSGVITTWDHADIRAENPGLSVPAGTTIKVAHRTLGSSSTGGITGYLHTKCPTDWTLGTGSTVNWPVQGNVQAVQGSPGMQTYIRENNYAIGYLDAGHGHDLNFEEIALTNRDGQTRTSRQSLALGGVADAGTAGVNGNVFPTDATADWSAVNLYDMAGANTWPIVLVSYLYVKKDQTATNPRTAAALQAFIATVLNNRDNLCAEFSFTPPSQALRDRSLAAAATIAYPAGMQSFTFETSTEPYTGMGVSVISSKRHGFDDYERSVIRDDLASLSGRVGSSGSGGSHAHDEKKAGAAGPIVVSIIAMVVSMASVCCGVCAFMSAKARS